MKTGNVVSKSLRKWIFLFLNKKVNELKKERQKQSILGDIQDELLKLDMRCKKKCFINFRF